MPSDQSPKISETRDEQDDCGPFWQSNSKLLEGLFQFFLFNVSRKYCEFDACDAFRLL